MGHKFLYGFKVHCSNRKAPCKSDPANFQAKDPIREFRKVSRGGAEVSEVKYCVDIAVLAIFYCGKRNKFLR